jgi:hypothetical protein
MSNINKYTLVYTITALPNILFANITTASEPLSFNSSKFTIPEEVRDIPIELRICLFNPSGNLVEMTSNILPHSSNIICQTAELSGLRLASKLIDNLKSNQVNQ